MARHRSSERPTEATDFALKAEVFDGKFEDCLGIMVASVGVWCTLGPAVVSIVPYQHVDILSYKEFQPETVRRMHLLLIALGIWTKEDYSRVV